MGKHRLEGADSGTSVHVCLRRSPPKAELQPDKKFKLAPENRSPQLTASIPLPEPGPWGLSSALNSFHHRDWRSRHSRDVTLGRYYQQVKDRPGRPHHWELQSGLRLGQSAIPSLHIGVYNWQIKQGKRTNKWLTLRHWQGTKMHVNLLGMEKLSIWKKEKSNASEEGKKSRPNSSVVRVLFMIQVNRDPRFNSWWGLNFLIFSSTLGVDSAFFQSACPS